MAKIIMNVTTGYAIDLDTGIVTRLVDNMVVAPTQSVDELNYVAYIEWVNAGNEPTVLVSPTPAL